MLGCLKLSLYSTCGSRQSISCELGVCISFWIHHHHVNDNLITIHLRQIQVQFAQKIGGVDDDGAAAGGEHVALLGAGEVEDSNPAQYPAPRGRFFDGKNVPVRGVEDGGERGRGSIREGVGRGDTVGIREGRSVYYKGY